MRRPWSVHSVASTPKMAFELLHLSLRKDLAQVGPGGIHYLHGFSAGRAEVLEHAVRRPIEDSADLLALFRALKLDRSLHEAGESMLGAQRLDPVETVLDDPGRQKPAEHHPDDQHHDDNCDRLQACFRPATVVPVGVICHVKSGRM